MCVSPVLLSSDSDSDSLKGGDHEDEDVGGNGSPFTDEDVGGNGSPFTCQEKSETG